MKFPQAIDIKVLADEIGAKIMGDSDILALGINEIHKVENGDITFVDVEKYFDTALQSAASIILLNKEVEVPTGKTLLVVEQPFDVFDQLIQKYRPKAVIQNKKNSASGIHPGAIIEDQVIIGENVKIGKGSYIQAGVVIRDHVLIGENVEIQSGSVIGTDAFYFKKKGEKYQKWTSGGNVIIEDNVQIGANCTINKCVTANTIIGKGSKLDCQIQIGHGVEIGQNCLIAAQVGIAGNTVIEDNVIIYGQVGIGQNLRIGKGAIILATSAVSKDLAGEKRYLGVPAMEAREFARQRAILRNLPGKPPKN